MPFRPLSLFGEVGGFAFAAASMLYLLRTIVSFIIQKVKKQRIRELHVELDALRYEIDQMRNAGNGYDTERAPPPPPPLSVSETTTAA